VKDSDIKQWILEGNFENWVSEEERGVYAQFYRAKFDRLLGRNVNEIKLKLRSLLENTENDSFLSIEISLELAYLEWLTNENYKNTLKLLKKKFKDEKSLPPKLAYVEGIIELRKGHEEQALRKFVECFSGSNETLFKARALNNIAGIQITNSDYKDAVDNYRKAIDLFSLLNNEKLIISAKENLANALKQMGELEEASDLYEDAIQFYRSHRLMKELAQSLHNAAVIQQRKGEYNKAVVGYSESMKIREGLDQQIETSWSYLNLGKLYLELGEITKAIENVEKSLVIRRKLGTLFKVAQSLQGLGRIHLKIDNIQLGRDYLMESLNIFLEENDYLWTSDTLFLLITSYIEEEDYERAKNFFGVHSELVNSSKSLAIKQRHSLLEGLLQTGTERASEKFLAIDIFEEIVNSPQIDFKILSIAMIYLADLYILELKLGKNEKVIEDLESLLERMLDVSLESQSYPIYISFLLLSSRLKLVQLKAKDSLSLLQEALNLCEEKGLIHLHHKVEAEINVLEELLVGVWEKMIGPNSSLIERLRTASIIDYMNDVSDILKNYP